MTELRSTPFDDLEPLAVLTAAEVAQRLGVDSRSVRRAIARGDLRASRACGLRVLAGDAAAWWRGSTIAPTRPERPQRKPRAVEADMPLARRFEQPAQRLPIPPRAGA